MKKLAYFSIVFLFILPNLVEAQIDTTFDIRMALGIMMHLEEKYNETKDTNVANELIQLYEKIETNEQDTSDTYIIAHCRMLAVMHRYDEAIALSESLYHADRYLLKRRLCLMKASYENDTMAFALQLGQLIKELDDITYKYADLVNSLMRIPLGSGLPNGEAVYIYVMFRMKYCYLTLLDSVTDVCNQLKYKAAFNDWNVDQLNWLTSFIQEFDYMSLAWW